ncbi:Uncharacterized protein TPAR_06326 [Tolypocladium paradoxum]|uniref:Uncharacterized protein n=1 Tax=Tolypocladium paradoxum TaxID=94208 RepID=A0A2S4KTA7_9HYPO|nr:Uncharacterized protein TPAR_06326 [Tolypocladium paradoxum]
MASLPRGIGHQVDCSTTPNTSRPRPRLLRSSVTEPSITAQNAIRGSLASPVSPEKAADILSKPWVCPGASVDIGHVATPELLQHQIVAMIASRENRRAPSSSSHVVDAMLETSQSDCYFSFPNFENWGGGSEPCESKDDFN